MRSAIGTVLVTGADGFVGRALCDFLRSVGHDVVGVCRSAAANRIQAIGDIGHYDQWQTLLPGIDVVVHLAGRAHVLQESADDPLEEFRRINVLATDRLARAAVGAGVRRLVFVSSIGVNGVMTRDRPFTENDPPDPAEPYAISKYEAEQRLREIEYSSDLELVIIRPPLIYGPRVKGNFLRLLAVIRSGIPLPFGAVRNLRSYLGLQNFCELLVLCSIHPDAAGELLMAADGTDVSTPELLAMISDAMDRRLRIPSVPLGSLRVLAMLAGRRAELERLTNSLQVDASRARSILNWTPGTPLQKGIGAMMDWYQREGCG